MPQSAPATDLDLSGLVTAAKVPPSGPARASDGLVSPGNVDLFAQPSVANADGTTSTVDSRSFNIDGREVLLPSVTPDGRHLSTDTEIVREYRKTGRHLGIFQDVAAANRYAAKLHDDYAAGAYTSPVGGIGLDLGELVKPATDQRSVAARAIDAASTPLLPSIARGAKALADRLSEPRLADAQLNDVIPGAGTVSAMIRGGLAGGVQGAGDLLASFTSPLGAAATVSGLGAERAGAAGLVNAARALRGVEAATGAAFAERGLEQAASAPDLAGKAIGVAQAAGGALGARSGIAGLRQPVPPPVVRPVAGALPPGPSFIANERGVVAPLGEPIPMVQAPDGSYVRGVPAEYAKREVRGALPPGPGFVVGENGVAMPLADALNFEGLVQPVVPKAAASTPAVVGPDPSGVRSVPAAPMSYEMQGRKLVPSAYSGDVNAQPAPPVDLRPELQHALRWIKADMENLPFVKRTFNEIPRGRGGDLQVTGGAAGAPIYQAIIGNGEASRASRADVLRATDNLLQGKRTPVGDLVLGIAESLAQGNPRLRKLMALPPDAGNVAGTEPAFRIDRLSNLSEQQRPVQEKAASSVEADPEGFVSQYREQFGNVVSADLAKELFPEYAASNEARTANDLAVHRPAAAVANAAYDELVREPTPPDKDPFVLLTAGGTGAGKTSSLGEVLPHLRDRAAIVYDSTLSNFDGARHAIDLALENQKQVGIVYAERDIVEAFNATLARANAEGRPVTINTHVRSHQRAAETFQRLREQYADDPRVEFILTTNGPGGRQLASVADWQPRSYNEGDVRARLTEALDAAHQRGDVSDALAQAVRPPGSVARMVGTGSAKGIGDAASAQAAGQVTPPQTVPEFAQALATEGARPIAEAPFALTPEAVKRRSVQPSLIASGPTEAAAAQTFAARSEAPGRAAIQAAKRYAAEKGRPYFVERRGAVDVVSDQAPTRTGLYVSPDGQVVPFNGRPRGEAGAIDPMLAARLGTGGLGAAYGAATGKDTTDRLKRAAMFGAAGAIAPSLLTSGAGGAVAAGAAQEAVNRRGLPKGPSLRTLPTTDVPSSKPLPPSRVLEFPSLQKMPEPIRAEIADLLEQHGGFAKNRRNVQPMARTEALADRIAVPLKELRPGTALNAEELAAYKNAVASVMTERQPLAEKVKNGTATPVEQVKFSELTDRGTVLLASYRGAKAEAGRALNILRNKARVLQYGDEAFIQEALAAPGFQADLKRISQAAIDAGGDPLKQLQALRGATQPTRWEVAQSAYYAGLLSGVKTHLRNTIGNSFNMLANLANPLGAVPMDIARSQLTGAPRTTYLAEIPESVVATFTSMPSAFRDAMFTLRHGFTPRAVSQAAAGKFDVVRAELPGGSLLNLPSRALEAADAFFRTLAYQQELTASAYAKVRGQANANSGHLSLRMSELMAGDTPEALKVQQAADRFAARAVFQEEPGPVLSRIIALKNDPNVPGVFRGAMTFVAPFLKTPGNILRQGAEYTPAGFLMKAAKAEGREGAQALGRAALGSLALAPIAYLAATGRLSGNGPTDAGERAALMEKGWRPNSVKIGDSWVAYNLFQPMSVGIAAVANAHERFAKSDRSDAAAEESLTAALSGAAASFLDQSFLAGVSGLLDAVQDPERNAKRFMSQFAQGLVPASGLMRNVTQAIDPVVRKPEGAIEAVKTIVPGLSDTVPPRRGRFGQEITRQGGPIRRGFTVPEISTETSDPVAAMLEEVAVHPQVPRPPKLVIDGKPVAFTREQADLIVQAIGQERRQRLERLMQGSPVFTRPDTAEGLKARAVRRELAESAEAVDSRVRALLRRREPLTLERMVTQFEGTR